jgi:BON domain
MTRIIPALAAVLICSAIRAAEEERNWFDDPFFQVSSAVARCPTPAGPFVTEREKQEQSHRRAEKGTTCWLAGRCERPNSYLYDRDIAAALQAALAGSNATADTSLWLTVQGRVVYVEGCARRSASVEEIEALLRAASHVEQVISIVRVGTETAIPYRIRARD